MIRIIAIVGSNNANSITNKLICALLEKVAILKSNIIYEVLCLKDFKIDMCKGCGKCFYEGVCSLEGKDELFLLKKKMRESNIVIFASPVYLNNVSGIMKNFMDRLALYTHTLNLAGKWGFTLTVTSSSGGDVVANILKVNQLYMGAKNLNNFTFIKMIDLEDKCINEWANKIVDDVEHQFNVSCIFLEERFKHLKKQYKKDCVDVELDLYEVKYWNQEEIKRCNSFQEFAVKKKRKDGRL